MDAKTYRLLQDIHARLYAQTIAAARDVAKSCGYSKAETERLIQAWLDENVLLHRVKTALLEADPKVAIAAFF